LIPREEEPQINVPMADVMVMYPGASPSEIENRVVKPQDPKNTEFAEFKRVKQKFLGHDKYGQLVFLADSDFSIQMTQQKYPTVELFFTSDYQKR
ncbi:MAG: hypothetical protein ACKO8L_05050, partial [Flavobacterium sp.]